MKITLTLPICVLLALPVFAQDAKKDTAPQGKATERKDDKLTAADPAIKAIDEFIKSKGPSKKDGNWKGSLAQPPKATFAKDVNYEWHMKTNKGDIKIKLMPDVAPMHVSSTIYLARLGFYDGVKFHRVLKGFMAQGGDPTGSGSGGPGYNYDSECDPKVKHDRAGLLSMANTGRPTSDGSQFFLTFGPADGLNMKHTVFGEVTSGMETLKALEACSGSRETNGVPPTENLVMEQTWIVVTPKDAPKKAEEPAKKGG